MKCSYCNFENPEKSRFCGKCGKVFLKRENSYTKIFVALIIIGILAIIMLGLPKSANNVDDGKITPPSNSVLTKIIVSPPPPSIIPGDFHLFNAQTLDQSSKPITASVKWSSSNSAVGTIDSSGMFMAKAAGSTIITASSETVSGTATVTVNPVLPVDIKVSPATVSIVVGSIQTFTAVTLDRSSKPITAVVIWSSSNTAVGTIDSSGRFMAKAAGTTTITASSGSASGISDVTVKLVPPTDQISNFRVSSTSSKNIQIMVDYSYNTYHGTNVGLAAYPLIGGKKQNWFGYSPAKVNIGTGSGTIGVTFGYSSPPASVTTDQIQVDLYEVGGSTFYSQRFDYSKTWSLGLIAPTQISPVDGSVFSIYPRTTTLTWSAVSGATSYTVLRSYCSTAGCNDWAKDYAPVTGLTSRSYTFDFVGAQPGRWRVWAVDASGQEGPKSDWWGFSYTR